MVKFGRTWLFHVHRHFSRQIWRFRTFCTVALLCLIYWGGSCGRASTAPWSATEPSTVALSWPVQSSYVADHRRAPVLCTCLHQWLCLILRSKFDYGKDAAERVWLQQGRYKASSIMAMFDTTEQVWLRLCLKPRNKSGHGYAGYHRASLATAAQCTLLRASLAIA